MTNAISVIGPTIYDIQIVVGPTPLLPPFLLLGPTSQNGRKLRELANDRSSSLNNSIGRRKVAQGIGRRKV